MAELADYLGLITPFHATRPRFKATVATAAEPFAALQALLASIPPAYDLYAAIGAQLDVDGEWIGRTRFVAVPLPDPWFRFDEAKRGIDRGIWQDPFDTPEGVTRLDDESYRTLLRAKIAANNWDGTIEGARAALEIVFTDPATLLVLQDNFDMTAIFGIAGRIPSLVLLALLSLGYLPLKPHGVLVSYVVTSVDEAPLFGFDMATDRVAGFETGAWGQAITEYLNTP